MRHAVLIGMNYESLSYSLKGCWEDVERTRKLLLQSGFNSSNIICMYDNLASKEPNYPSKYNILRVFSMLIEKLGPSDIFFFQWSGHGFTFVGNEHVKEQIKPQQPKLAHRGNVLKPVTILNVYSLNERSTSLKVVDAANVNQCVITRGSDASQSLISQNNTLCRDEMYSMLSNAKCTVFGFVDTCSSGELFDLKYNLQVSKVDPLTRELEVREHAKRQASESPVFVFTSTRHKPTAWENQSIDKGGVCTQCFHEYLQQHLEEPSKSSSCIDLLDYLDKHIADKFIQDPQLAVGQLQGLRDPLFFFTNE